MDDTIQQFQDLDGYIKDKIQKMNKLSLIFKEAGKYLTVRSHDITEYVKFKELTPTISVTKFRDEVDSVMSGLVDKFAVIMNDGKVDPKDKDNIEDIKQANNQDNIKKIEQVISEEIKPVNSEGPIKRKGKITIIWLYKLLHR